MFTSIFFTSDLVSVSYTHLVFYNPEDESVADTVSIYQMYKGAILVARNEYQFDVKGGNLNLTVQTLSLIHI